MNDAPVSTGKRVLQYLLVAFILWSLFVMLYPAVPDAVFYSIAQPVKVLGFNGEYVRLEFTRRALWSMAAICNNELHCDSVQEIPPTGCPLEGGSSTFAYKLPFLSIALNGGGGVATCVYRGTVQYAPFGTVFGPVLTQYWESETFEAHRGE